MQNLVPNKITGEWELNNDVFNNLFYMTELYNSIMKSDMKYHFIQILKDKGYDVEDDTNEAVTERPNEKDIKEKVKENNDNTIQRALTDDFESLTSSEIKIRQQIEQRSKILCVKVDNEEYFEELTNNKVFTEHINLSQLVSSNFNGKMLTQAYKEFDIQSVKSNVLKVKLIHDVAKSLDCHPLEFEAEGTGDVELKQDQLDMIKKVFRLNELKTTDYNDVHDMMKKIVKQVSPSNLFISEKVQIDGKRTHTWSVDKKVLQRHLNLISHRNDNMDNIHQDIMKYANFKKTLKKLF